MSTCLLHYYTMCNMSTLIRAQSRNKWLKVSICPYCLSSYGSEKRFEDHMTLRKRNLQKMELLAVNSKVKFEKYRNMIEVPFVIYFIYLSFISTMNPFACP